MVMNKFRLLYFVSLLSLLTMVVLETSLASQNENSPPSGSIGSVTLPPGTVISVRIGEEINSNRDQPGDVFAGTIDRSVLNEDQVVIPRGTEVHIQLVDVKKGGHIHGKAEIELELANLVLNGDPSSVDANPVEKRKGGLSTKAQNELKPGIAGAAEVGASVNPVGALALGGIAAFKAAKVDIKPGSRIPFTLSGPFTFNPPPLPEDSLDEGQAKKKRH